MFQREAKVNKKFKNLCNDEKKFNSDGLFTFN